jgi:hypothetical protein
MRFFRHRLRVTVRITAPDSPEPQAFDALLLLGRSTLRPERVRGLTPYERELADVDATVVVSPVAGESQLSVECEVVKRGRVALRGWSSWPIVVIQRRRGRVFAGGLDGPFGDGGAGTAALLQAI